MKHRFYALTGLAAVLGGLTAAWSDVTVPGNQGPSTASTPYVVPEPAATGVRTVSILTVGESVNTRPDGTAYRLVGLPDGAGGYDNGDGTFTMLVAHELNSSSGVARAHGSIGAFVSAWTIEKDTLKVRNGADLVRTLWLWNSTTQAFATGTTAFDRFCSADLPAASAFWNAATGKGVADRIFLGGEETGGGRAFAHVASGPSAGVSAEIPKLGKQAWENVVASPYAQDKTVIVGIDDSSPGQIVVYVGTKQATGTLFEKAGLRNGTAYGLIANGTASESRTTGVGASKDVAVPFTLAALSDQSASGASTETELNSVGATRFLRPEDGAWDPSNPADFYFVTTDQFDTVKTGTGSTVGRSRLYRLRFADISDPTLGGTITMLVDGTEAHQMLDNIGIDRNGNLLAQEDPGNQAYLARIWHYEIATGNWRTVARFDQARFGNIGVAATSPFNQDEESSGIFDAADLLGAGWWLFDAQAHSSAGDTELSQHGQLCALFLPESVPAPSFAGCATVSDTEPEKDEAIAFSATASVPGGGAISYAWDFGDGSTATGQTVGHAYTTAGSYTAVVTATHGPSGKSATSDVRIEVLRGSSWSAIQLHFDRSGKDSMTIRRKIPVPAGFSPAGTELAVNVGGVERTFTLDANGAGASGDASIQLVFKTVGGVVAKQTGEWFLKVTKADLASEFANEGLLDETNAAKPVLIEISATLGGKTTTQSWDPLYTSTAGEHGVAR